jgi:CelD/BcsL family acetyltransferase involved in cellulose biosynthesis
MRGTRPSSFASIGPIGCLMSMRLTPIEDLSDAQLGAWRELAARAVEPNPFFEPEFVLPAVRHLEARRVALLSVERGGELMACLPVRRHSVGPLSTLAAWHHPYTFLGTPLADGSDLADTLEELFGAVRRRGPALLTIDQLGADGPIAAAIDNSCKEHQVSVVQRRDSGRAALTRDTALASLDADKRQQRDRRRRWRMLEEDLGAPIALSDRAGNAEAVEDFLQLEASGWKGAEGTALASSPRHAEFFREVSRSFAAAGRLQLLTIGSERRNAAMSCNIVAGDTIFCFKLAFDEELRRGAPGVQLVYGIGQVFRDERSERLIDSCAAPSNKLLNRLWTDRRTLWRLVSSPPGFRSVLSRQRLRTSDTLRAQAQKALSHASGAKPTNV